MGPIEPEVKFLATLHLDFQLASDYCSYRLNFALLLAHRIALQVLEFQDRPTRANNRAMSGLLRRQRLDIAAAFFKVDEIGGQRAEARRSGAVLAQSLTFGVAVILY